MRIFFSKNLFLFISTTKLNFYVKAAALDMWLKVQFSLAAYSVFHSTMKNRLEHNEKKKSLHVCFRLSKQLFIQTKMLIALNIRFGVNMPLWCSFVTLKLCCMKMRENSSVFLLLCAFYVYIMTVCFGERVKCIFWFVGNSQFLWVEHFYELKINEK